MLGTEISLHQHQPVNRTSIRHVSDIQLLLIVIAKGVREHEHVVRFQALRAVNRRAGDHATLTKAVVREQRLDTVSDFTDALGAIGRAR
jgi:hypothetical protein